MSSRAYILDEKGNPVPEPDMEKWSEWMWGPDGRQQVALDDVGGARVSTVFLGLDHNFYKEGPPILWETMIFPQGDGEEFQQRYASLEEARAGHILAVALARKWGEKSMKVSIEERAQLKELLNPPDHDYEDDRDCPSCGGAYDLHDGFAPLPHGYCDACEIERGNKIEALAEKVLEALEEAHANYAIEYRELSGTRGELKEAYAEILRLQKQLEDRPR